MRNILGKLITLFLIPVWLIASNVQVSVDKREVTRGDTVTFTITAEGENIDFPVINSIDNFPVLGTAQRSNISIINGNITKSLSKSYTFAPMKDVTIPSFELKIDGKTYKTDPIKVKVTKVATSSAGSDAILTMSVDKREVHVGEPVNLTVTLKYRRDKNYVESQVESPEFSNFWIKQVGNVQEYVEGNYIVKKVKYIIFPQKAGNFKLEPLTAKLARRVAVKQPFGNDPFFNDDFFNTMFARLETKRIASNTLSIEVKPLPNSLELYGKFDISVTVDKKEVEANKPVKVGIRIDGYGNIDDIKKFDLNIPDAVVYADEPKIDTRISNGKYGGTFMQTITVVAESNFTIPSLTLKFVDSETNQPTEIKSEPIKIFVKGGKKADTNIEQKIVKQPEVVKKDSKDKENNVGSAMLSQKEQTASGWLMFIIGLAVGVLSAFGISKFRQNRVSMKSLSSKARAIRQAKDEKELFELLLPYIKDDPQIEDAVKKLEENLFKGASHRIDKKLLAEIIEEIEEESGDSKRGV
ncbi:BatD family protein [Hydrogenimonas thermophila]|uniref:Oxygen tolerance n=1 Tax=Hydrogenimonas thermophila TaxID=223786 RepID=A0A1I5QXT4_9BACT|nr:BatD family protein [Hydrogenimonas thermophila]SFP51114.1 Oxygen tolerance [Hydrogenimonas thermophila]